MTIFCVVCVCGAGFSMHILTVQALVFSRVLVPENWSSNMNGSHWTFAMNSALRGGALNRESNPEDSVRSSHGDYRGRNRKRDVEVKNTVTSAVLGSVRQHADF